MDSHCAGCRFDKTLYLRLPLILQCEIMAPRPIYMRASPQLLQVF